MIYIKFKTSMKRLNLCDYSSAQIHVKGSISIPNTAVVDAAPNKANEAIFKNCAPFTNCISKINNTQIDDAHGIDVVIPMYNLM